MLIRSAFGAALALTLSGCWMSDKPLMPAAARDPAPITGEWSTPGDYRNPPKTYRLVPRSDGRVMAQRLFETGWADDYILGFDRLSSGVWLVEAIDMQGRPSYPLLFRAPNAAKARLFSLRCSAEVRSGWPEVREVSGECAFSTYRALYAAAGAVAPGVGNGEILPVETRYDYSQ